MRLLVCSLFELIFGSNLRTFFCGNRVEVAFGCSYNELLNMIGGLSVILYGIL